MQSSRQGKGADLIFIFDISNGCDFSYRWCFHYHCRTTFSEFAVKYGRDTRFKTIEKMKDREAIFVEFITAMRKREKEDSKSRGEKVLLTHSHISVYSIFCRIYESGVKTSSGCKGLLILQPYFLFIYSWISNYF